MLLGSSPILGARRERVVALAAQVKLPVIYQFRRFVEVGGLMSYDLAVQRSSRTSGLVTNGRQKRVEKRR